MNFLAHFHTTNKDIAPYKLLGVILPDVARDFSRIHNKKLEDDFHTELPYILDMLAGIKLHIKGDDLFHNHRLFKANELIAKEILDADKAITVKRKFVIAHVIIELMIDQYIMNNNPGELELFYNKLDEVNISKANEFFQILNVEEDKSHFLNNFNHFRERQFLYHLKEDEGVIMTLDKVFGTIFAYNFVENKALWMKAIKEIKVNLHKDLPILLEELKANLNE